MAKAENCTALRRISPATTVSCQRESKTGGIERMRNMNEVKLHIPNGDELEYRRFLIADEETMTYNIGYGDNGGGTYHHTPEQALKWLEYWNSEGNFYAYVARASDDVFVGEVSIHFPADYGYPKEKGVGWIGVVIEGKQRRKGYGEAALRLLVEYAFNTLHLRRLLDDIPADRNEGALRVFDRVGFRRSTDGMVMEIINNKE